MTHWKILASLVAALCIAGAAQAQTYTLSEPSFVDSYYQIKLSMTLAGTLKLQQEGREIPLKESATATHEYVERPLEAGPENTAVKSARIYKDAKVSIVVDADKLQRKLRSDRYFLMARREQNRDGVLSYCPNGLLSREELDVVDHFDTLALTGLLPAKEVALGDTWKLGNLTAQVLCHFQGLSEHTLVAKLERVQNGVATVSVSGSATGIDLGASVNSSVKATFQFDTKLGCLTSLEWIQKDDRGAGPVSPASSLEMTIKLARAAVDPVSELSDVLLVPVRDVEPGRNWIDLVFKDAKDRFELVHSRDWQLVGRTDDHVVLRLMDRGDFVAQVTIAPWKKAETGSHLSPDEVKSIVANSPGWTQDTLIKAEEIKLPSGQWAYLVAGEGDLDGMRAVQYIYLVAGPGGDQAVLTFTMTPAQTQKLGSRDLEFVHGFTLPGAAREGPQSRATIDRRQTIARSQ
jgi:hypothetical protein